MELKEKIVGVVCRECGLVGYVNETYLEEQKRCLRCSSENILIIDHDPYHP